MYEYQIEVWLEGELYFRTDWDSDKKRAEEVTLSFTSHYGIDSVTVTRRSKRVTIARGYDGFAKMFD